MKKQLMKLLLLFIFFINTQLSAQDFFSNKIYPLVKESLGEGNIWEKDYRDNLRAKVYDYTEENKFSTDKYTDDPDFPVKYWTKQTYLKMSGLNYLLSEAKYFTLPNGKYWEEIHHKYYDYNLDGKRFLSATESSKYGEYKTVTVRQVDGSSRKEKVLKMYLDGISEQWTAPNSYNKSTKCRRTVYISNYEVDFWWDKGSGCTGAYLPDVKSVNEYDLRAMIKVFLIDFKSHLKSKGEFPIERKLESMINGSGITIDAIFETIEKDVLGISYGKDNSSKIILKINPQKWKNSSPLERWYTIYHELGHDVLRLRHGEGGEMMFNYSITDENYSWEKFFEQRDYMFNYTLKNIKQL